MADQRRETRISRHDFFVRGVHPAPDHVSTRESRFHAVLYLFRLEKYQRRVDGIYHRVDAAAGSRILSRECVAEYSRHFERVFAERRAAGVCGAIYFGGNTRR